MEIIDKNICFGGEQLRIKHQAHTLSCEMIFSLYLPPQASTQKVPLLWWLSGLTCNDQNFVTKAGSQRIAAELGIAIIAPDTSPRGDEVPDDGENAWDFGLGASFYINATQWPWAKHYRMYDYIQSELPALIAKFFAEKIQVFIEGFVTFFGVFSCVANQAHIDHFTAHVHAVAGHFVKLVVAKLDGLMR